MITELLLAALVMVESGGKLDLIGDQGRAVGPLQIHEIYVYDVNRVYGTNYVWPDDVRSLELSKEITVKYLQHYARESRLGRQASYEDLARIHNGGPNGYRKESTKKYWNKVNKTLKDLSKESK